MPESELRSSTPVVRRILALVTDAYGGHGGIAVYNRDVIDALSSLPQVDAVVALPRKIIGPLEALPEKLDFQVKAAQGKLHFAVASALQLTGSRRPQLVYCAHINLLPIAIGLGALLNIPVILTIYGIEAWQPTSNRLVNRLISQVDSVIAISNYTKDKFLSWAPMDPKRIALLPNAIHLERYGIGPKPPDLLKKYNLFGNRVLMTFGRLVSKDRAKGFDEVLNILPTLLREIPDLVYVIAGDGPYRIELENKARRLGICGRVIFTGLVPETEKADLYRAADVYVMPSRGEGFGFVFLEAMACGIPVIASSVDGSRDAVRNGEIGEMVDPADPGALHTAIIRSLHKPHFIPPALEEFSFPNFTNRLGGIVNTFPSRSGAN